VTDATLSLYGLDPNQVWGESPYSPTAARATSLSSLSSSGAKFLFWPTAARPPGPRPCRLVHCDNRRLQLHGQNRSRFARV